MTKKSRSALAQMPDTAAFLADIGRVFGRDDIVATVRAGVEGRAGCFHAVENGHEFGTPFAAERIAFTAREIVLQLPLDGEKGKP